MDSKNTIRWSKNQVIYYKYIKRAFDFLAALIILILTCPILLVVVLLIKIDSKGPAFFSQNRIGKDNREFVIYKLRTMDLKMFDENGNKIRDRDRVTKIGKMVRKLSIDELPQLFNVIKGEMSFIGPRPLLIRYLPYYNDYEINRHNVLPGITGLAQVNGRSFLNWEERFNLDVEYVKNISFLLDLKIVYLTVIKVFKSEGTSTVRPSNMVDFDKHRNYKKQR